MLTVKTVKQRCGNCFPNWSCLIKRISKYLSHLWIIILAIQVYWSIYIVFPLSFSPRQSRGKEQGILLEQNHQDSYHHLLNELKMPSWRNACVSSMLCYQKGQRPRVCHYLIWQLMFIKRCVCVGARACARVVHSFIYIGCSRFENVMS